MLSVLWLVGQPQPLGAPPTVSTVSVSTVTGGSCGTNHQVATPAVIRIAWSVANPDPQFYSAKLFENGILMATQDTAAAMHVDKTIAGAVEGNPSHAWTSDWEYRVDIVRKTTQAVVSSATSATWAVRYGDCSGDVV